MTLNSDSRLVRFAYSWPPDSYVPVKTTLCRFFWRTFVFMPLAYAIMIGLPVTMTLMFAYETPKAFLTIVLGLIWSVVLISSNADVIENRFEAIRDRVAPTVFWQGVKSLKSKVCPIIRFD